MTQVPAGTGSPSRTPRHRRRTAALAAAFLIPVGAGIALVSAPSAGAATIPTAPATVTGLGSGKCVDARAAATANGTAVQQYTCNGSSAQQWQFTATDSGYYRIGVAPAPDQVWDVTDVSTADSAKTQLWLYGGGANQQWLPVAESGGSFHFVNRNSGKCLDVPGASTADSVQLQQYTCNGTAAQSFTVSGSGGSTTPPPGTPDFGPNVTVFDPSMSTSAIQSKINSVYSTQVNNEFGTQRNALLFTPGTYNVDVPVGYYTQVAGLGLSPDQVSITGGGVHVAGHTNDGNATQIFWRDAENMSLSPSSGSTMWAASQADPFRRMDVHGGMLLYDNTHGTSTNWSSGGYVGNSRISGTISSGTQQQYLTKNTSMGGWSGSNWNMVFVGDTGAPGNSFPNPPDTTVAQSPTSKEKPFLYVDSAGNWQVFNPALRTNAQGPDWTNGTPAGTSIPIGDFYIVKPGDTATTMNNALAAGKNLLVTPGVYHLSAPLNITRPDTVVLGMGIATLVPDNGVTAVTTADVGGIDIAGLLISANTTNSATLMQIGPAGSSAGHAADPTVLQDVFFRVGGDIAGKATTTLVINSANVIGDDLWLWRGDHSNGVGWNTNPAAQGLVVNGSDVTMYGLAVEHYEKYQTTWNGNGGRTYFYQSETPYDVPDQGSWTTSGGDLGYASYKVANSVTSHEAWGVGVYAYLRDNPSLVLGHAIEVPTVAGVKFHNMVTTVLGGAGTINHIIDTTGAQVTASHSHETWTNYP
ncbi:RICIN domain-containing protein [Actinacidiphila bryophytorum]|uniref:Ricin-type beta-trefoil lectin domain-containing protein n=1 Tax=Actinacidiphila bryophytorum TaxID=1436133 RepID=A0A9W4H781_9ACTN|nr:RICIN domain-containing protein [Actinacidiphila bryophytorum]CAG7655608.1 Ricin-type beta-trefoil lectin domain-containing protein [Actinacidiphila bryophytorum]